MESTPMKENEFGMVCFVCVTGRWRGGSRRANRGLRLVLRRCPRRPAAGAPRDALRTAWEA